MSTQACTGVSKVGKSFQVAIINKERREGQKVTLNLLYLLILLPPAAVIKLTEQINRHETCRNTGQ